MISHPSDRWTAARRYGLGLLAVAMAAGIRMALEQVLGTERPYILFALAVMVAARYGGLGPGLVTTAASLLVAWVLLVQARPAVGAADVHEIAGVVIFVAVGIGISVLSGQLRKALMTLQGEIAGRLQTNGRLRENEKRIGDILDGISDGFSAFDRQWRFTVVNSAGARMLGKTRSELLGRSMWELFPDAYDSAFGVTYRRAVEENKPAVVEAWYPEPLNAWFEVRCSPSPEGVSLFYTDTTARKRNEERLRLLESATLQTNDAILIVAAAKDGGAPLPVFVNPAFERMTGCVMEELRSGAMRPLPDHLLAATGSANYELPVTRRDGSEFWAELSVEPIADAGGACTHGVWTIRDITERRRAAETARLLSSIVESSDDAILSKNLDGTVLSWNQGAERIYGYRASEMVGRPVSVLHPAGSPDDSLSILEDLRQGRSIEHCEATRIRKNGELISVSLTASPIRDESGAVVGGSVIARDTTQQKRSQEALRLSEERYRSLVSATTQIVWTTDAQGAFVEDNSSWSTFSGQENGEIRGWGWLATLHPGDREPMAATWANAVRHRSFYNAGYRVRRRDGEYRHMDVHGVPVLEKDGTVREWIGTAADVTDARRAEEEVKRLTGDLEKRVADRTAELQAANKELEAFAYSVSHDLRAPLRAVVGFSRILLEEYAPQLPSEARHYLEVARSNALQMGELIDGLLAFSKLGRQAVRKQIVSPSELARQTWDDLGLEWQGRTVEMVIEDLPPCEADPLLLKQVFANLLSNALKYTRKREVARIELGSERREAQKADGGSAMTVYSVRDNGVGFDMRYVDKLFGVFQRLHAAEEYEGTGIGLANVKRLIHKHGGSVWAWGEVNRGATFYFALPGVGGEREQLAGTQEQLQA